MKIAGLVLVLVGIVAFLNNTGIIVVTDWWSIAWPLLIVIVGVWVKHGARCKLCGMGGGCGKCGGKCEGGKCEMGQGGESHSCEGGKCSH